MTPARPARLARLAALAVPVLSVLLVAGCGSSSKSSTNTTVAGSTNTTVAGSVTTATAATGSTGTPTTGSSSSVASTCPSQAAMSTALGIASPAAKVQNAGSTLLCNYNDTTGSVNVVVVAAKSPGLNQATLKSTADSQAAAQKVTASPVSGVGDSAYSFTLNDASSDPNGVATTALVIQAGSTLVDITGDSTLAHLVAVAHLIVG